MRRERIHNSIILGLLILVYGSSSLYAQETKGLYVDGFYYIIGNPIEEDKLLSYAKDNEFNYLILYNTAKIHRGKYALDQAKSARVWRNNP